MPGGLVAAIMQAAAITQRASIPLTAGDSQVAVTMQAAVMTLAAAASGVIKKRGSGCSTQCSLVQDKSGTQQDDVILCKEPV